MSLTFARAENVIVEKTAPTAMAVARLLTTEKWSVRVDEMLKQSSASETGGDAWNPKSPAWHQAKSSIFSRITQIIDSYATSGELEKSLSQDLAARLTPEDASSIAELLGGPAGASVLRFEATTLFVSMAMAGDPNSPASGQPGWIDQMRQVRAVFESKIGPDVPPGDPAQGKVLKNYTKSPARQAFMNSLSEAVGKAVTSIDGSIQLDLFDAGDEIEDLIQEAVTQGNR